MLRFCRHVFTGLGRYRVQAGAVLLLVVLQEIFRLWFPLSLEFIIDRAIVPHDFRALVLLLTSLGVSLLITEGAGLAWEALFAGLGCRLLNDLRLRLFAHLQELSAGFYARAQPGDVLARFSTDMASLETAILEALIYTLQMLLGLVLSLAVLLLLQWELALLVLVGIALSFLLPWPLATRATKAHFRLKEELGQVTSMVQENVAAQPIVQAFELQRAAIRAFEEQLATLFKAERRATFLSYFTQNLPGLTFMILTVAVLISGFVLVFEGRLTVGQLMAFYTLLNGFSYAIYQLSWCIPTLAKAAAGLQRIEELLREQQVVTEQPGAVPLPRLTRCIELRGLRFSYVKGQAQLEDVHMSVRHGWFVAVVGPSGSGKSTLVNLLLRFYDPDVGSVLFDEHDVRLVTLASLRAQIGVVFQDNFLFDTTVRANLRMGRPGASDIEVEDAARAAEIHDFIVSLPQGYDTLAGERGGRFSGGQRQRLALARALLRDPALLILDEATSALDAHVEESINRTIHRLAKGRTVFSVSHRLATVADADHIVVMDAGRVAEQGTHAELLRNGGVYAGLWQKQTGFRLGKYGDRAAVTAERLRELPIFCDLEDGLRECLAAAFVSEHYTANRTVFEQGSVGDKFFVIVRGKVALLGSFGQTMKVLQDGDHFGEIALLEDVPRAASVRTLADCDFLTLRRAPFLEILQHKDDLREALRNKYLDHYTVEVEEAQAHDRATELRRRRPPDKPWPFGLTIASLHRETVRGGRR
jgi:ATP-binding cassette, subfamily B, bacterial